MRKIGVYRTPFGYTVGQGLGPAGQFVKQIDVATDDKSLFSFGKSEKYSIFWRQETASALR